MNYMNELMKYKKKTTNDIEQDIRLPQQEKPHEQEKERTQPRSTAISYRGIFSFSIVILAIITLWSNLKTFLFPEFHLSDKSQQHKHSLSLTPAAHLRKPSYLVTGKKGVVASEEGRCSKIGIDVLKANGTATDAAIATALCVGVVNSFATGIGGGGFMIIKPPESKLEDGEIQRIATQNEKPMAINFRETIPNGEYYREEFEKDNKASKIGGLSIGIPGELAGFKAAFDAYGGGVSWNRIFQPAVDLAKNFSVGHALAAQLQSSDNTDWMALKKEWKSIFFNSNSSNSETELESESESGLKPAKLGDWIQRSAYSRTLQIISDQGIDSFYSGEIAESLVQTINKQGGRVNLNDFKNYKAMVAPAINTTYHGYSIWTTGPPSSGAMLLHLMNILEPCSLHDNPRDSLSEHRFIEALKYAFSARTELGDPNFLNSTQLNRIETIKSKQYGHQTSLKIDDNRTFNYSHYQPKYDIVEDHGTTHLSVIDQFGSVVSLTSTVNLDFGSTVMDANYGIILNDQNDDFSIKGESNYFGLVSSPLNYPVTGKRPISSIAPIIVDYLDSNSRDTPQKSEFFCALGASGGSRIFSAVSSTFLKLLWGYDLSHSIEDPRLHHQLLPNQIYVETSYRPDFLKALKEKGHATSMIDIYYGKASVHGIHKPLNQSTLFGSSDSRKFSIPDAY